MNLVFVGHRCCDHSPSSGYDQVCSLFPEAGWLSGSALEAGRLEWYREPNTAYPLDAALFHVIYGDCSGKTLPTLLRKRFPRASIVSSAHQPVSRLVADRPACAALMASDAIVTVSEVQAHELEQAGIAVATYAIPHGVWTKVFRPAPALTVQQRSEVLIVGSFLRDWDGTKRVVGELSRSGVRSIALGAGARDNLTGDDLHVEVLPRVSEADLAELYDRAAALFLPFLDATASNALLEGMAAGCPVVCPRLPSLVEEYLGDDSDSFDVGRYDVAVARLSHYVRNPVDRARKSREVMARADKFDWCRMQTHYEEVYEAVSARPHARLFARPPAPSMEKEPL